MRTHSTDDARDDQGRAAPRGAPAFMPKEPFGRQPHFHGEAPPLGPVILELTMGALIGAIVIGILAGWIAEQITGRRHGLLMNLIVGLVGAFIGFWLAGLFNISVDGFWERLVAAVVGATLLLAIFGLVRRRA